MLPPAKSPVNTIYYRATFLNLGENFEGTELGSFNVHFYSSRDDYGGGVNDSVAANRAGRETYEIAISPRSGR
jgi:hypothetical protein